ncbi:hypothetical protein [Caldilinea sp.]|uniref:hypothetical protein n=1 Tax=Caldilinea sp. TaxID=2293560 RepID=UPI0031CCD7BA
MNSMQPHLSPQPSATSSPSSAWRRRPFGLYMILILLTVQALLGALLAVAVGVGALASPGEFWSALEPEFFDLAVSLLLLLITALVAIGLWRYQRWGWYGMMLLLAYYMATDAIGYFGGQSDYLSMVLNVTMVFYLNQREVRDLFETPAVNEVSA